MYQVQHHAYSGLSGLPARHEERYDARYCAAQRLKRARRRFKVVTLERGRRWEICEPENCTLVPDACGTLTLTRHTFECRECGCEHDTRDNARQCCVCEEC